MSKLAYIVYVDGDGGFESANCSGCRGRLWGKRRHLKVLPSHCPYCGRQFVAEDEYFDYFKVAKEEVDPQRQYTNSPVIMVRVNSDGDVEIDFKKSAISRMSKANRLRLREVLEMLLKQVNDYL